MSQNIKFKKDHFTLADSYFYMFDDDTNVLYQKTSDGSTSFSYPLDNLLESKVNSLEHDGVNFWTLETGTVADTILIKRWNLENYVCKQRDKFVLSPGAGHKYDSKAFTVEHYHTTLSGSVLSGDTKLPVNEYWDKVSTGMNVTVGPNIDGVVETINVQDYEDGKIVLSDPVSVDYPVSSKVNFYTNLWIFNNYNGEDDSIGALYKINAYTGSFITKYPEAEYKNVSACTFYKVTPFSDYGDVDALCYVKMTNILFLDISSSGLTLPNFGSMVIDNVEDDNIHIIEVFDLAIEGANIYKLQHKANYFGNTESFTNSLASYHVATQTSMVTSMSLLVNPTIISANGISSTSIIARVKDQFFQPVVGRLVYFEHDDPDGVITGGTPVNTDSKGEAGTIYRSGVTAREVKISATVEQV